jgi:hypothetical protein
MAVPRQPLINASSARWIAAMVGVVAVGIVAWAVVALTRGEDAAPPSVVSARDIDMNRDVYLGQTVTVIDTVQEVLRPGVFTLGDTRLIVIHAIGVPDARGEPNGLPAVENELVQVTGSVRVYDIAELEKELGWDFSDEAFWQLADNQTTVIAQEVSRVPAAGQAIGD